MRIQSNGLELEVEEPSSRAGAPILLIMGLGMQLTAWPPELIDALAGEGYAPIVFDNRDVGLSTRFDAAGVPNLLKVSLAHALRLPIRAPYLLADMARDTLGLLDALGLQRVHVLGISMGGMIAQLMAAEAPQRISSLTLIMSTSGARSLPGPTLRARRALLSRPRGRDIAALVEHGVGVWQTIGSPGYPADPAMLQARVERSIRRAYHPQGLARQLVAVAASGDRSALLGRIRAPTQVIHGRADPLVPLACGIDLARKIPRAQLETIDGMGHDMPAALAPRLAALVAALALRS